MGMILNFQESWQSRSKPTQAGMIAGVVVIVLIFALMLYMFFGNKKAILFSDLEPRDAAAIVAELERMKIDYKLKDDGRTILVKEDEVYEARINIVGNGITLNSGVGFEIFDEDNFGTTEFAQKINFQRALQGELSRTIMALDAVKNARVHLVMPESSIFKQSKQKVSASVTLFMKHGKQLNDSQIFGIQNLVASSVPELEPDNISVINQHGNVLKTKTSDTYKLNLASTRLAKKQEVEDYLKTKAQKVLDHAYGAGMTMVTVNVDMNFDNVERRIESLDQANGEGAAVIRKREIRSTKKQSNTDNSTNSTVEVDYALGKNVEKIIKTPGGITRVNVAVILPENSGLDERQEVEALISRSIGLDANRGDMISVVSDIKHMSKATKVEEQSFDVRKEFTPAETDTGGADMSEQAVSVGFESFITQAGHLIQQNLIAFFTGLVIFFIIFIFTVLKLIKNAVTGSSGQRIVELSDVQRKEMLNEITEWLKESESPEIKAEAS